MTAHLHHESVSDICERDRRGRRPPHRPSSRRRRGPAPPSNNRTERTTEALPHGIFFLTHRSKHNKTPHTMSKHIIVNIEKFVVVQTQPPQKHGERARRLFPSLIDSSVAAAEDAALDRTIEDAVDAAAAAAACSRVQRQCGNVDDEPREQLAADASASKNDTVAQQTKKTTTGDDACSRASTTNSRRFPSAVAAVTAEEKKPTAARQPQQPPDSSSEPAAVVDSTKKVAPAPTLVSLISTAASDK